jgi:histidinol dehydrogenase
VTDSPALADGSTTCWPDRSPPLDHTDRIETALTGPQSAIVLVDDIEQGLKVVDAYGAEHLEVQTREARAVAHRVKNAGAIFIGPWAPVPLGDYSAGSTHVLPTAGAPATAPG